MPHIYARGIQDKYGAGGARICGDKIYDTEMMLNLELTCSVSLGRRAERALWFLGPAGSGPFFHVHPAAYNALKDKMVENGQLTETGCPEGFAA